MDIAGMTFLENKSPTKQKSNQSWKMSSPDTPHRTGEVRRKHNSTSHSQTSYVAMSAAKSELTGSCQSPCRAHSVTALSSPALPALPRPRANPACLGGPRSSRGKEGHQGWVSSRAGQAWLGEGGELWRRGPGENMGHLISAPTSWWVVHMLDLRHLQ